MKLHRFDALSFVFGLLITGAGLVFLLLPEPTDIIEVITDFGSWFWPAVFIAIGAAILAPLAVRSTNRAQSDEDDSEGLERS